MNHSQQQTLKKSFTQHLGDQTLNDDEFEKLEALMKNKSSLNIKNIIKYRVLYIAAFFILAFIASTLLINKTENLPQLIAEEVVRNHLQLKPLEVKTNSINDIRSYFTKLDFSPINSDLLKTSGLTLIGGRYCSLQGISAAQLRLSSGPDSAVQTFYQTEYRQDVFGLLPDIQRAQKPIEVYARGIKVKIWLEKGLLIALTEAP